MVRKAHHPEPIEGSDNSPNKLGNYKTICSRLIYQAKSPTNWETTIKPGAAA
jgi:hypothetical protein